MKCKLVRELTLHHSSQENEARLSPRSFLSENCNAWSIFYHLVVLPFWQKYQTSGQKGPLAKIVVCTCQGHSEKNPAMQGLCSMCLKFQHSVLRAETNLVLLASHELHIFLHSRIWKAASACRLLCGKFKRKFQMLFEKVRVFFLFLFLFFCRERESNTYPPFLFSQFIILPPSVAI